ncbi:MAG: hypothetical protein DRH57_01085 [Candidatus Cloacimonadota bacterium]|nr:MAG: hypothetical protein DRH57_01085 [Candidatus Cloacimonadota bacterium]
MNKNKINKIIKLLRKRDDISQKLLLKEGYSKEEIETLSNMIVSHPIRFNRPYNRILSSEEEQFVSVEAYGYLSKLLYLGSIDEYMYEKIILLSSIIGAGNNIRLDKNMMKKLVNYLLFHQDDSTNFDDMLDNLLYNDNDSNRLLN